MKKNIVWRNDQAPVEIMLKMHEEGKNLSSIFSRFKFRTQRVIDRTGSIKIFMVVINTSTLWGFVLWLLAVSTLLLVHASNSRSAPLQWSPNKKLQF